MPISRGPGRGPYRIIPRRPACQGRDIAERISRGSRHEIAVAKDYPTVENRSWTASDERCGRRVASGEVATGSKRSGRQRRSSSSWRGDIGLARRVRWSGFILCVRRGPFEVRRTQPGSRRGTGCRREGASEENEWAFVALSNKPLQRMNAARPARRWALPRRRGLAPAAPRGRDTIARPFGVHR